MIAASDVFVWMHTWWGRASTPTPDSIKASDVTSWHLAFQPKAIERRKFFLGMLDRAAKTAPFMLRLEDDVTVNEHLLHNVLSWPPLREPAFGMGFLSTCERVQRLVKCVPHASMANTLTFRQHGYHFGGGWIASTKAVAASMRRISDILDAIERLNGRFGPTTSVADALIDAGRWKMYVHDPSLVHIDVSLPSHQLGDVSARYGLQPFDPRFRRS